jgi:hypothetical protein
MSDRMEEVHSALAAFEVTSREDWLRVCWALEREFGEAGQDLWIEFSQRGYGVYSKRETDHAWARARGRGQIPLAWVFKQAMDAGWKPEKKYAAPSSAEIAEREQRQRQAALKMDAMRQHGSNIAENVAAELMLPENSMPLVDSHPYLDRKRVPTVRGLRVCKKRITRNLLCSTGWRSTTVARYGDLIVPICDEHGRLVSVQTIDANGDKRYIAGSKRCGCTFSIPGKIYLPTYAVEGLATGLTVSILSGGAPVLVCFDTAGLTNTKQPFDIIAADNDENGAGASAAKKACAPYVMPPIPGMDWNDYALHIGYEEATRVFQDTEEVSEII